MYFEDKAYYNRSFRSIPRYNQYNVEGKGQ